MNPDTKTVLVTGATGAQGGAVAQVLLSRGHRVRALTRDPQSPAAQFLSRNGTRVLRGDFDKPRTIADAASGADAVYIMGTPFERGPGAEIQQTITTIDAVLGAEVGHIVYSSVASARENTGVPHFESKAAVEHHLDRLQVPHTVVAPTAFLSDLTGSPFWEGVHPGSWDGIRDGAYAFALPPEMPLQMVSLTDLGQFVQLIIENPTRFDRSRIEIASVEVSGAEIATLLSAALNRSVRYQQVPLEVLGQIAGEDAVKMTKFLQQGGYAVDIPTLHARYPEIQWQNVQNWIDSHAWTEVNDRPVTSGADHFRRRERSARATRMREHDLTSSPLKGAISDET